MKKAYKILLLVLALAFLVRLPFVLTDNPIGWDSAAYAMNARFFSGNRVYFEDLRPPLLPLLLAPVAWSHSLMKLVNVFLAVASIAVTFFLIKEISSRRVALLSCLLLATNFLFLRWTSIISIEGGEILFSAAALYFFLKARKDSRYFYGVGAFTALAFLFRYNLALVGIIGGVWYFLSTKPRTAKNLRQVLLDKHLWGGILVFIIVITPWLLYNQELFGDPLHSMKEAARVFSTDYFMFKSWEYYFVNFFIILNPLLSFFFLVGLIRKKNLEQRRALLVFWMAAVFIFFQFQGVKDVRYLVPILPVMMLFAVEGVQRCCEYLKKRKFSWVVVLVLAMLELPAAGLYYYQEFNPPYCENSYGTREASLYIGRVSAPDSVIYSSTWPITAYYSNRRVKGIFVIKDNEQVKREIRKVDYVSFTKPWFDHPIKKKFLDSLEELEYLGEWGKCQKTWVYRVKDEYKEEKSSKVPYWDPNF